MSSNGLGKLCIDMEILILILVCFFRNDSFFMCTSMKDWLCSYIVFYSFNCLLWTISSQWCWFPTSNAKTGIINLVLLKSLVTNYAQLFQSFLCTYVLAFRILSCGTFLHIWFKNSESVLHSTRSHIDFILQSRRLYCNAQRIYKAYHLVMIFLLKEDVYSLVCNKYVGLQNLSEAVFWGWNGSIWILSHVLFATLYIIFIVYIM